MERVLPQDSVGGASLSFTNIMAYLIFSTLQNSNDHCCREHIEYSWSYADFTNISLRKHRFPIHNRKDFSANEEEFNVRCRSEDQDMQL